MIQQTSINAYKEIKKTNLNQRQQEVYQVLKESFFGLTNKLIAWHLDKPINEITPRTNELVKMGLVKASYKAIDRLSKKEAIFWEVTT